MKIDKDIYKYVNKELQRYEETKRTLEEDRAGTIDASPTPPDGQPKGNGTGNPTESKALKLITCKRLQKMEEVVNAITKIYESLSPEYRKFFDVVYIQHYGKVRACIEANLSEKTYYRWKDNIVEAVARELGLIN